MNRILVVEDDSRINALISDFLKKEDFMVTQAFDGIQGIDLFESDEFDLVILDIMMPGVERYLAILQQLYKN